MNLIWIPEETINISISMRQLGKDGHKLGYFPVRNIVHFLRSNGINVLKYAYLLPMHAEVYTDGMTCWDLPSEIIQL